MTLTSFHLSVRIERPYDAVRAYVADPSHMKEWAAGLADGLARRDDDVWIGESAAGAVEVRFVAPNPFGVMDHTVTLPSGDVVRVPLRVLSNGDGSEVVFTLFRLPAMTDAELAADRRAVEEDLATLKRILEGR